MIIQRFDFEQSLCELEIGTFHAVSSEVRGTSETQTAIKAGTWVEVRSVILDEKSRASGIPEDTADLPLMMWVKGYLTEDCRVGENAVITTMTGRTEQGILEEVEPATNIDYGGYIPEIAEIGRVAREVLFNE